MLHYKFINLRLIKKVDTLLNKAGYQFWQRYYETEGFCSTKPIKESVALTLQTIKWIFKKDFKLWGKKAWILVEVYVDKDLGEQYCISSMKICSDVGNSIIIEDTGFRGPHLHDCIEEIMYSDLDSIKQFEEILIKQHRLGVNLARKFNKMKKKEKV